jgi:serine/threonine-protein kinase
MSSPLSAGTILAGKYRIDRVLGQGGMGAVVAAHHLQLDEEVAIKFLLPEALSNRDAVARFDREARAAVKIRSEHTVRVSDVGTLESGAPYMVMELLRGRDLGQVLQERGPLPLDEASDYLLQACEAIVEAHTLGIVHRDLKPPNLFLTHRADGSPCVKVIDFGISKVTTASGSEGDHGMTRTNALMGSPFYMSPEHLMSARDVDMRTDVWALGVILYEFLTARLPFTAMTLPQLCTMIMSSPPAPIRNHLPDLHPGVEALILGCLEKDRDKRVPTVAAFALQLGVHAPKRARLSVERIERLSRVAGFSGTATTLPPSSDQGLPGSQTVTGFGKTESRAASPTRWWLAGVAAAALVGAVAFAVSRRGPEPVGGGSSSTAAETVVPPVQLSPPQKEPPPEQPLVAPAIEVVPSAEPAVQKPPTAAVPQPKPQHAAVPQPKPPHGSAVTPPPKPSAEPRKTTVEPAKPAPTKPGCDPNFYFDAQGQKHFKRECF